MAKKKVNTDNVESVNGSYKYEGEGELIKDKPSTPLEKKPVAKKKTATKKKSTKTKNITTTENVEEKVVEKNIVKIPTNKEIYNNLVNEGLPFILKSNGAIIFDSDKDNVMSLNFQNDDFFLNGITRSYDNTSFKFKK